MGCLLPYLMCHKAMLSNRFHSQHKFLTQPCHGDVILYKEDFYTVISTTCLEQQSASISVWQTLLETLDHQIVSVQF